MHDRARSRVRKKSRPAIVRFTRQLAELDLHRRLLPEQHMVLEHPAPGRPDSSIWSFGNELSPHVVGDSGERLVANVGLGIGSGMFVVALGDLSRRARIANRTDHQPRPSRSRRSGRTPSDHRRSPPWSHNASPARDRRRARRTTRARSAPGLTPEAGSGSSRRRRRPRTARASLFGSVPLEAADRHHRVIGCELDTCCAVCPGAIARPGGMRQRSARGCRECLRRRAGDRADRRGRRPERRRHRRLGRLIDPCRWWRRA